LCSHLQRWAGERDHLYALEEELKRQEALDRQAAKEAAEKEAEKLAHKEADAQILKDDKDLTQRINEIMRRTGIVAGVNVHTKKTKPKRKPLPAEIEINLRPDVDMAEKRPKATSKDYKSPFDADLRR
jgi:hypothetical protein